ncbi:hypothetical protein SAMN06265360_107194 [Haloechinothrix alba]|uniref:Uncharacterized protein n=1 Tax=Haloechinothrix alba TaxID=664784 RepID=A0A238WTR4_9PSEU|nr:hypothetical protein [Haloechinothrix alba]SNR49731.1 hypothetical protein SAMN06265360_107194 [Haloechinothrix alba]
MNKVIATIACGLCAAEGHEQCTLGHVVKGADGAVYWRGKGTSGAARRLRDQHGVTARKHNWVVLRTTPETQSRLTWAYRPPEQLVAHCRRHGRGTISTPSVTTSRGTVAVEFTADAI